MSVPTIRSLLLSLATLSILTSPFTTIAASSTHLHATSRATKRLEQRQVRGTMETDRKSRMQDLLRRLEQRRAAHVQPIENQPVRQQPPQQPVGDTPAPSPVDTNISSIRQQIMDLVNAERQKAGLSPVSRESHLESAAQAHAEDMNRRNYFEHNTPEGTTPTAQMQSAGYPLSGRWSTGQNIARGQTTAQQVMDDWMNSPGHRQNILNASFQHLGVGYANNYWVQDFGSHQ